jgi:hypothetical protein
MSCNVGGLDRVLRIVVGLALIALVFVGPHTPWGWIGVIGWCPAYVPFGVSSCARNSHGDGA